VRRIKAFFFKARLHSVTRPLGGGMKKLAYLSELSKWCSQHSDLPFNDRDNPGHTAEKRFDLYRFVFDSEGLTGPIDYLEFGVGKGRWFRWWVENNRDPESRFVGFDTFTGLPEAWGGYGRGAFSTEGETPKIDDPRCRFESGLFQETLGPFLEKTAPRNRIVAHLDADLYSSTLFALTSLAPRLKRGDILLFDEFGVPMHEFRAFMDFLSAYPFDYEVLGAVNNYLHVAAKLK
jgi:hypothetical protein